MSLSICEHCGENHTGADRYCPRTGQLMAERLLPSHTLLEDKYLVRKAIGVGGMGAVFDATHTLLDKRVAIKVLLNPDQEASQRFLREARSASATGHRNITAVTDMGRTEAGELFVVMEYLDGRTVKEMLEEEPLPVYRALKIAEQILSGLVAVHKRGIIHRDLKPDNVMVIVEDDETELVKILDFGISKMVSDDAGKAGLTSTGVVMGTPLYMAPEQAKGQKLGPPADIYAVGAILFAMLTGRPPHLADTLSTLIAAKLEQEPVAPSTLNDTVPQVVDTLVLKALAIDPASRYPRALDMRRAILSCLGDHEGLEACASDPDVLLPTTLEDDIFTGELVTLDGASHSELAKQDDGPSLLASSRHGKGVDMGATTRGDPGHSGGPGLRAAAHMPQSGEARGHAHPHKHDGAKADVDPRGDTAQAEVGAFAPMIPREIELELDNIPDVELARPAPAATAGASRGTLAQARSRGRLKWGRLVLIAAIVGGAGFAYHRWGHQLREEIQKPTEVRIRFATQPENASIHIDGVFLASQPLYLRSSDRVYQVRVSARGYFTKALAFFANRDQVLTVKLRPKARSPLKKRRKTRARPRRPTKER